MFKLANKKKRRNNAETLYRMYEYTRQGLSPYMWDAETSSKRAAEEFCRQPWSPRASSGAEMACCQG